MILSYQALSSPVVSKELRHMKSRFLEDLSLKTSNYHVVQDDTVSLETKTQEYKLMMAGIYREVRNRGSDILTHTYTWFHLGQINEHLLASVTSFYKTSIYLLHRIVGKTK